jgi:glucose/arabinose dehydrogenase
MRYIFILILLLCAAVSAQTQQFPPNFSRIALGGAGTAGEVTTPTAMAFAPDGRIFVCQQNGLLRIIKNDLLLATPFLSLPVDTNGERGLIGIVLDPDFATNNYLYLYYTVATDPIHNRVSRFTALGDVVLAGSEVIILELDDLSSAINHNGGAMAFGPDGKLYIATGENALPTNAQNLNISHGKLLRINKDGGTPSDNPFPGGTAQRQRVWSLGLRNPYTFCFQPGTGKLFVNDVGQDIAEEINDATTGGHNFGWPLSEGMVNNAGHTSPVYHYLHATLPGVCAITGGIFFNPSTTNYPGEYTGKYFFQDLCGAWIYYIDPTQASPTPTVFGTNVGGQSLALNIGPDGNLYYLSRSSRRLYRVRYTRPGGSPQVTVHPQPTAVFAGQSAQFTVTATGTAPLSYQWQKDDVNITAATQQTLTLTNVQLVDAGNYRVVVSNGSGTNTSNAASLTVNAPPATPLITSQPADQTVDQGQSVTFTVEATGTPPLTYQWKKNLIDINGAISVQYTIATVVTSDAADYSVVVSNGAGSVTSDNASLTVTVLNVKPVAEIVTPTSSTPYVAGTSVSFSGTGTDQEDGTLPASAFEWAINFHHDTHQHDQPVLTGVTSGSFNIPDRGEISADVWFRIILTVTDSDGGTHKDSVDIHPLKSTLSFRTQPPGFSIVLDGQPTVTPVDVVSVEGLLRDINITDGQVQGGVTYQFDSWSIGGEQSQTITTPSADMTVTAVFTPVLSAGEWEQSNELYPLPASTIVFIRGRKVTYAVAIDALGRPYRLQPVTVNDNLSSVDVTQLNTGVFVFQYSESGTTVKRKVLIAR